MLARALEEIRWVWGKRDINDNNSSSSGEDDQLIIISISTSKLIFTAGIGVSFKEGNGGRDPHHKSLDSLFGAFCPEVLGSGSWTV